MAPTTIAVPLDPETAQAYNRAAPEEKQKIQALVSLWVREFASKEHPPLQEILDKAGSKAKARGLTAEILDSILKGIVAVRVRYQRDRERPALTRINLAKLSISLLRRVRSCFPLRRWSNCTRLSIENNFADTLTRKMFAF